MSVLCLGETMATFRAGGPLRLGGPANISVAGAESNVAIGLRRLEIPSQWVGVVGSDELGALVLRTLRAEGVDCSTVRVDRERPTGVLVFEPIVGARTRAFYYRQDSAGSRVTRADVERAFEADVDAVVTSGITPALGREATEAVHFAFAEGRRRGALTCLDLNYRSALWTRATAAAELKLLVEHTDVVMASTTELALALGDSDPPDSTPSLDKLAKDLLDRGLSEVVVTRGRDGSSAWTGGERYDQKALAVQVVDTVGAGDAFTAGYLSGKFAGVGPADRLWRGAATAAFCIGIRGDWEGLPTPRDLALLEIEPGEALR